MSDNLGIDYIIAIMDIMKCNKENAVEEAKNRSTTMFEMADVEIKRLIRIIDDDHSLLSRARALKRREVRAKKNKELMKKYRSVIDGIEDRYNQEMNEFIDSLPAGFT